MSNSRDVILVTGCAGFIGSHLIAKLLDGGYCVDGVDDFSSGRPENILQMSADINLRHVPAWFIPRWEAFEEEKDENQFVLFHDDFASDSILARIVKGKYSAVIHLAAEPSVEKSIAEPVATYMNNVQKTVSLMSACAKSDTKFVFASSAAVYGNTTSPPVSEDDECFPLSPYALQKKQIEETGILFSNLYGLSFTALRFFNVYGPGQDGSSPYSTVIASWREKLAADETLRLDGDGNQTRDYIHVTDVARACELAVNNSRSGIFNIATGTPTSNNDILKTLKESYEFDIENAPPRLGDIVHSVATVEKASAELGFDHSIDVAHGIKSLFSME